MALVLSERTEHVGNCHAIALKASVFVVVNYNVSSIEPIIHLKTEDQESKLELQH